jgi:cytochrome c biogenesis protein CcdA
VTTGGFLVVFGGIGGAVSLGAFWISSTLPWAGLIIGLALAATGLVVLAGRDVKLRLLTVKPAAAGSGLQGDFLFGVGYGVASLSCTLPVFLAVTGTAVTGGMIASVFSFVAYAFGMGTIFTALAVGVALSRGGLAAVLGRLRPYMNRAAGAILFLAGAYVATFWGTAIFAPELTGIGPVVLIGEDLSRALRGWLGGPMGRTATYALLILLITLFAWTVGRRVSSKIASSRSSLPRSLLSRGAR